MKIKKEYLILTVIIVGLSVYLALHRSDQTHYQLPVLPPIDKKSVTKIEVVSSQKTIVLNRKTDKWTLDAKEYPADGSRVDDILDVLGNLSLTDLVSESENYGRYDLDKEKRIKVRAWVGGDLKRDIAIGRAATSFRHTFVQLEGEPRVYLARENFRNRFELTVDQLRDKSVLSFEKTDIQELHLVKNQQTIDLIRQQVPVEAVSDKNDKAPKKDEAKASETKSVWRDGGGQAVDTAKVERLLTSLSQLKCNRYIDDKQKADFADPIYTVRIKGNAVDSLSVFAKATDKAGNYPAISSQNDYPFLLDGSQVDTFMSILDAGGADQEKKNGKE